ncbi:MAG: DUF1553 domain-containing protein [Verrucomicrobiota bacterium]
MRTLAVILLISHAAGAQAGTVSYNRDVRPILSENCFHCHGQDPKHREADLRLDERDSAVAVSDGSAAIFPGDPTRSAIIQRMLSKDPDEVMPPPKSHRSVTPAQVEVIRRWIAEGAEYERHWSFVPPKRAEAPKVNDGRWARTAFDRFVLARLEREGLRPSPEAAPAAWLRRVSLDLNGLPPTPSEIDAFESDVKTKGERAYEESVGRLLASPHFGERLAQDWLDVARYADTHGFNNDSARSMWRWRDWVIDAFNAGMPFDRFVTEQLAGDLLPGATTDQRLATAFNRNHVINSEGGIIDEEYRVEYVADRVRTTSTALLGLTAECARCHDHKYDPFSTKDYYRLFAFFNNVTEYGEDGRVANAVPLLPTPTAEQSARTKQLESILLRTETVARDLKPARPDLRVPDVKSLGGRELKPVAAPTAPAAAPAAKALRTPAPKVSAPRIAAKDVGVDTKKGTTLTLWVKPTGQEARDVALISALDRSGSPAGVGYGNGHELRLVDGELEWIASQKFPAYATVVRTQGAAIIADRPRHVAVILQGKENHADVRIFVDGTEARTVVRHDGLTGTPAARDWSIGADGVSPNFQGTVEGLRSYPSALSAGQIASARLAEAAVRDPKGAWTSELAGRNASPETHAAVDKARTELLAHLRSLPTTMVMAETPKPRPAFVLVRGAYEAHGEPVTAGVPEDLLAQWPEGSPKNRLGLARWFLRKDHPLTARVVVNRFWAQLFGTGIVKTVEDFGLQGEWPSHPEALDLLARDFIDGGWDVKAFFRTVTLSATYRQDSRVTPELQAKDPENRLLARGPRFRLPAETIRDQALAAAGLLTRKIGGPSVRPYQPEGLYKGIVVDAPYPSTTWENSKGEDLYRRSLYTFWKRTVPHPAMIALDAPDREFCSARRARTNTPLQALVIWNETGSAEAARKLGERMLREGGADDATRVSHGFRLLLGRRPSPQELEVALRTLARLRTDYAASPADAAALLKVGASPADSALPAAETAAFAGLATVLLSLDETLTKN